MYPFIHSAHTFSDMFYVVRASSQALRLPGCCHASAALTLSFFHVLVLFLAEPINARTTHVSAPARSSSTGCIGGAGYGE